MYYNYCRIVRTDEVAYFLFYNEKDLENVKAMTSTQLRNSNKLKRYI